MSGVEVITLMAMVWIIMCLFGASFAGVKTDRGMLMVFGSAVVAIAVFAIGCTLMAWGYA